MRPLSSPRDRGLVQMQMKAYVDTETGLFNERETQSSCRIKVSQFSIKTLLSKRPVHGRQCASERDPVTDRQNSDQRHT